MHRLLLLNFLLLVITAKEIIAALDPRFSSNLCAKDFLRLQNKCYFFSDSPETWQDSYWKCRERDSNLAVLSNKNQVENLREFLSKGYVGHVPRWLGGQYDWKKDQWIWAISGKLINYYIFTASRTSDKNSLKWHCLLTDPNMKYKWSSGSCLEKKHYICQTRINSSIKSIPIETNRLNKENIPLNNISNNVEHVNDSQPGFYVHHIISAEPPTFPPKKGKKDKKFICPANFLLVRKKCYFFSTNQDTWQDAFYKCVDFHSELAVLKNVKQDMRLRNAVQKYGLPKEQRWLGGRYDWQNLSWKWAASGQVVQQQMHRGEHLRWACILWDPKLLNKWSSESCLARKHYICQTNAGVSKKTKEKKKSVPIIEMEFNVTNNTRSKLN